MTGADLMALGGAEARLGVEWNGFSCPNLKLVRIRARGEADAPREACAKCVRAFNEP